MTERQIAALIHGRYLLENNEPRESPRFLVGFHGYGENSEAHLKQLRQIPGASDWLLCSVQSLHLFYNTKTREVVGSWMTRLNREQMITDNIRYIATVVAELSRRQGPPETLVFAGFSQGVAMAYRAAAHSGFRCDGIIALAGDVPPEIASRSGLALPPVLLGRGSRDPWYTQEKMEADIRVLSEKSARLEICEFEGDHDWSDEFSKRAGQFLRGLT